MFAGLTTPWSPDMDGLNGPLPEEFSILPDLRVLSVPHNFLTGTIPENYGRLEYLSQLDLSTTAYLELFPLPC